MIGKRIHAAVFACSGACALLGCSEPAWTPKSDRPIVGLESGQAVTFTSSPDGGALSVLYDTATIEIPGSAKSIPSGAKAQSRDFRMVLGNPPRTLRFQIRGFRTDFAPGEISLAFVAGGKTFDVSSKLDKDNYFACFEVAPTEPTLDVKWTGTVKQKAGQDVRLDIDSIDISALADGAAEAPDCS